MISKANLNIPPFIEDLTKVNFENAKKSLDFRFIKEYETTIEEIITSRNRVERHISSPDAIRFSPNEKLVEKINELGKNIPLFRIPKSYHPQAGYYEIHAIHSRTFFKAIRQLQAIGSEISIPLKLFEKALCKLQKHKYLTPSEANKLQSQIKKSLILEEHKNDVVASRDVNQALALAYYYRNADGLFYENAAFGWLCKAKQFLGEKSLGSLIDFQEFLIKFTCIDSLGIFQTFAREISDAITICPSIKKLAISASSDYDLHTAIEIGQFLAKANFIEMAAFPANPFTKYDYDKLNKRTIIPIAEALRTNISLKELNLSGTDIGDVGVLKIIEAIESNPESKITTLNFFNCGMTDNSAERLLELFQKMEQMTWINVKYNFEISSSINEKFDQIIKKRNLS